MDSFGSSTIARYKCSSIEQETNHGQNDDGDNEEDKADVRLEVIAIMGDTWSGTDDSDSAESDASGIVEQIQSYNTLVLKVVSRN